MSTTKVTYLDNGRLSTLWRRVISSKLTWVVIAYIAAQAESKFTMAAFESVEAFNAAFAAFLPHALGGTAAILMRSAIKKSELASQAINPVIAGVSVASITKKPVRTVPLPLIAVLASSFLLTGCGGLGVLGKTVTNLDNKPIVTGEICVNTPQGRFCYIPDKPVIVEPETVPAGVASVPASTLPAPINQVPPPYPGPPPPPIMPASSILTLEK